MHMLTHHMTHAILINIVKREKIIGCSTDSVKWCLSNGLDFKNGLSFLVVDDESSPSI